MIRERLRSILIFHLKFWGLIILVQAAVLLIRILKAGGTHAYMQSTFSTLTVYGISILLLAEGILGIGLLIVRKDSAPERGP